MRGQYTPFPCEASPHGSTGKNFLAEKKIFAHLFQKLFPITKFLSEPIAINPAGLPILQDSQKKNDRRKRSKRNKEQSSKIFQDAGASLPPESPHTSRMTPTAMWKNMPTYPRFPHRGAFVPLFVVHICTTNGGAKGVTIGGTNGGAKFLEHAALSCSCKSSNDKGSRCSGSSQKSLIPVSLT